MKLDLHVLRICATALAICTLGFLSAASAQEESVRPGVNDSFQDPDVERYIKMFEGDGRAIYKNRNEIAAVLELEPGDDVGDIGAGTGFFSMMFAELVKPRGKVFAVDIAQNFIDHTEDVAKEKGHKNIKATLCTDRSVELKENSIDAAFICDVYHHFEYPFDTLASIHKALRADGLLVIVDFRRIKGVTSSFSYSHVRAGKGTFTDEILDSGFDLIGEIDLLEDQYILKFRKRELENDDE